MFLSIAPKVVLRSSHTCAFTPSHTCVACMYICVVLAVWCPRRSEY